MFIAGLTHCGSTAGSVQLHRPAKKQGLVLGRAAETSKKVHLHDLAGSLF
jgi:hypothetical protein